MVFTKEEYNYRLTAIKQQMSKKALDVLIITDPSNMNYTTGYDGWSFMSLKGLLLFLITKNQFGLAECKTQKELKLQLF